ncbi:MAG TPA: LAGLIDADG family homing endonuclease [Gammaproteobacteria bacterium]|nr:LAGLIDADG family homing endonuclease [Gammaproteobacteria bacterium]
MADYKQVRILSAPEAAYIAGVIDGEGTVALTRKHRGENRQLVVSISNTDFGLLEYIRDTVGAGRLTGKRTYRDHHTPSKTFTITNRQALRLLEQIVPYLRTYKAERAALILKDYIRLTPRNGRYTTEQRQARSAFEQQVLNVPKVRQSVT